MSEVNVQIVPTEMDVSIDSDGMSLSIESNIQMVSEMLDRDPYEGNYTITPTQQRIELQTKDKRMTENIVINPIPHNFGRIIWNGAFLKIV